MKLFIMRCLLLLTICFYTTPLIGQVQIDSLQELLGKKEYAKVIALADSLSMASDSTDYELIYTVGQAYEGLLRYRQAHEYYSRCYRMDTTNVEILDLLANTAVNLGRVAEAEDFYQRMVAVDTTSFYANNRLAKFYYNVGEYEKAGTIYSYLVDTEGDNPALLTALGNCYIKQNMFQPAIYAYSLAYEHNRENVALAVSLINTMLIAGEESMPMALAVCDTALYYNPDNLNLLRNKGMALYANERYREADTIYTNLMATGDSTYNTLKYCGLSRYEAGQFVKSMEPLEIAYLMDTTSIEVSLYFGSTLGQAYDRKRAFTLFDKAEDMMKPSNAYKLLLGSFRADTYRRNGQDKIAYQLYYGLWKEFPGRMDFLSQVYQMNSRYPFDYDEQETQQTALFSQVLFTKTLLDLQRENRASFFYSMRIRFQKVYDEMIFREVNSLPMLAPDGEKRSITIEELRALIDRLPNEDPAD